MRIRSNDVQLGVESQTYLRLSISLRKQKVPQNLEMQNMQGLAQGKDNQITLR